MVIGKNHVGCNREGSRKGGDGTCLSTTCCEESKNVAVTPMTTGHGIDSDSSGNTSGNSSVKKRYVLQCCYFQIIMGHI